ncbi:MAG: hypothetical protein R3F11_17250 [Verrucomicrobiales bacterium]
MTTVHDPASLRQNCFDLAADFLACGLDPDKATFFRQSDIPEVTELTWILSTVTPMGLLRGATLVKTRSIRVGPPHGTVLHPVLMAADILIYDSDIVPVGKDQKQHLEVTRDIAQDERPLWRRAAAHPRPLHPRERRQGPGIDGEKMSKSYSNDIGLFEEE